MGARSFLRSYGFPLLLAVSVAAGSILGLVLGEKARVLQPFGDIFLHLLFTAVVPLVFFSIASAVAEMPNFKRLGKILSAMCLVFVLTGLAASVIMAAAVQVFPPATGMNLIMPAPPAAPASYNTADQIVRAFAVPDFADMLSKKNMPALIVFSLLVGVAAAAAGTKGRAFAAFLSSGNAVMMKAVGYIMMYAPIGLCAYFACFVGAHGSDLLGAYGRMVALYYPVTMLYFFAAFTLYVWLAAGGAGVRSFWRSIVPAALTAFATGSSMAAIPPNLAAADRVGIPRDISEVIIPMGATVHMEGSCLAAMLKIAFLFGLYGLDFSGAATLLSAIGVALLCGVVVSGIPGGGVIGELLILSLYGFPPEAFPLITMIGTLVDAPATAVNAVGDNVASMLVARLLGGKDWMTKTAAA